MSVFLCRRKQSIFLYDDGRFDSSINGRNGFTLDQIYEEGPTHSIVRSYHVAIPVFVSLLTQRDVLLLPM